MSQISKVLHDQLVGDFTAIKGRADSVIANLSAKLTPAQQQAIRDVSGRATIGIGRFSGVTIIADAVPPPPPPPTTGNPSGIAMPVGDLAGWHQVFADDFTTPVALGNFPASVNAKWNGTYPDGWHDTSKAGTYMPSKVISCSGSVMNMHLHTEGGTVCVSAPVPTLPTMTYGRYDICARADTIPGYKTAWLLWPDSETWPRDGEIDFPEAGIGDTVNAYMHRQNGANGGDQDAYQGIGPAHGLASGWHVYTTIWTATSCEFQIDGHAVGRSTLRIPSTPMHYVIQTETDGGTPPATSSGNVQIDWVVVYTPAG